MFAPEPEPSEARLECLNISHLGSPGPRVQVSSGLAFLGPEGLADLSRSRDDQTYRTVGAHLAWNLVVACADTAWLPGCASGCARDTHRLTHDAAHSFAAWMPEQQVVAVALELRRSAWSQHKLPGPSRGRLRRALGAVPRACCGNPRILRASLPTSSTRVLTGLHAKVCVRVDAAWWQPAGWARRRDLLGAGTVRPMLLDLPARARRRGCARLRATPGFRGQSCAASATTWRAGATWCRAERRLLRARRHCGGGRPGTRWRCSPATAAKCAAGRRRTCAGGAQPHRPRPSRPPWRARGRGARAWTPCPGSWR